MLVLQYMYKGKRKGKKATCEVTLVEYDSER